LTPVRPKMLANAGGSVPPLLKNTLSALATLLWLMLKPGAPSVALRFKITSVAV